VPPFASAAMIPNPRLAALAPLVGEWTTAGSHAMLPGAALRGRTVFDWHEGGAFLRIRSEVDDPRIPTAVSLVGSDDATGALVMLYFDERGVSRRFDVAVEDGVVRWWRTAPGFSQRFTLAPDGDTLRGVSALSRDDATWEQDLELTYTRAG